MMFKDSRVQKGPEEGKPLVFWEWQIANRERKGKKKEHLTKRKTTKYQSPTAPPSSVTHALGGIVQVIPSCLWPHISATLFGSTVLLVKSFTVKVQLWILQSDFLDLQIFHKTQKQQFLQQKAVHQLSTHWEFTELRSLDLNFENASILFLRKCIN